MATPLASDPDATLVRPLAAASLPQGWCAATPAEPPQAGPRQMGRYLIRGRLGRGGMASVYRAHDPSIGRDVAIKVLHASLAEDAECRERFLREARAAGALSHANIVTVHDVGELEGRPFMAMELVEGPTLAEWLEQHPLPSVRDVATLGLQLARALDHAHAHGVVHRDVKPANILMRPQGRGIKVTDFGIAHVEHARDAGGHTQLGRLIGTPQYMSPEQARGEPLDGRSDLFSVGAVLYQALTGERLFKGEGLAEVARQVAAAEVPSISARRPDTPPALRRVVERCLARDRTQRWRSGAELAAALRRVLDELDAAQADRARGRGLSLRLRGALALAALVAVVMAGTGTLVTQRQLQAMLAQAAGYGQALASHIAAQNAAAVLLDDWVAVDVAVQATAREQALEQIRVVDAGGVVRAGTVAAWVGRVHTLPPGEDVAVAGLAQPLRRYQAAAGPMLGFEVPVRYRERPIGRVFVGLPEQPLLEVARLTVLSMLLLVAVTVLAVGAAAYVLARRIAQPVQLAVEALGELAQGRWGHRIGEPRRDEFGTLFLAIDRLAQALQRRHEGDTGTPAPWADAPERAPTAPGTPAARPAP